MPPIQPRSLIAIGAAVVVVLGGFLLLRRSAAPAPPPPVVVEQPAPAPAPEPEVEEPPPAPTYPMVLVATREIRPGAIVVRDLVVWREWTDALDIEFAVVKDAVDIAQVLGTVAIRRIGRDEMVTLDSVVLPGQPGFMRAVLRAGHRGVTVQVDDPTTRASIIRPGDRVDVIMVLKGDEFAGTGPAAQVLVDDVRVLAVGSSPLELGRRNRSQLAGVVNEDQPDGDTYTLEVTPADAERIALGASVGRLTLAMRSMAQSASRGAGARLTRFEDVLRSPTDDTTASPVLPPQVRIFRGGRSVNVETAPAAPAARQEAPAERPA